MTLALKAQVAALEAALRRYHVTQHFGLPEDIREVGRNVTHIEGRAVPLDGDERLTPSRVDPPAWREGHGQP